MLNRILTRALLKLKPRKAKLIRYDSNHVFLKGRSLNWATAGFIARAIDLIAWRIKNG